MKKKNKKGREIFCDISFFMKQSGRGGCSGCPRSRKCEEWNHENRIERNNDNIIYSKSIHISNDKQNRKM